ncbi:hypothetical protein FVQ98_18760 [Ottowia sp. GY511]|uniref:Uncharacterized protein n=1 Tax=Ottowia flava TaxID=2675430 RepID=A0ABW4KYS4_9BURK|nr:hypothetical protein [Ottowia sp. GY511]TXK21975.1 hypothetical protein FVQ98_18760 [Ottowia sp. GY511]
MGISALALNAVLNSFASVFTIPVGSHLTLSMVDGFGGILSGANGRIGGNLPLAPVRLQDGIFPIACGLIFN